MLKVDKIIALKDNYVYFITDIDSGKVAVVDPSEALPVIEYCMKHAIRPDFILNTHHHWDHVGGNLVIKDTFSAKIVGYQGDAHRIPGIDIPVNDNDTFQLGASTFSVMYIPGHTLGHIAYFYSATTPMVFCGDTMFSMGCGGNFEGSLEQLYSSLVKLSSLPDNTLVYCGHEYTKFCWRMARQLEGETEDLRKRAEEIMSGDTVPSTIGKEKSTNPYLRCHIEAIRKNLGYSASATNFEIFCALRMR